MTAGGTHGCTHGCANSFLLLFRSECGSSRACSRSGASRSCRQEHIPVRAPSRDFVKDDSVDIMSIFALKTNNGSICVHLPSCSYRPAKLSRYLAAPKLSAPFPLPYSFFSQSCDPFDWSEYRFKGSPILLPRTTSSSCIPAPFAIPAVAGWPLTGWLRFQISLS